MNRRKIKKQIKKSDNAKFVNTALNTLHLIRVWEKKKHENSKLNMKALSFNFRTELQMRQYENHFTPQQIAHRLQIFI